MDRPRRTPGQNRVPALLVAVSLLAAAAVWWVLPGPAPDREARVGGPFTLVADDGRTVTEQSFPGKYLIVYFGYTTCRDVCPATMTTLAAAMGRLGGQAARIQPLFITLDPLRDTPAQLHHYVQAFTPRLVGPRLIGLTGAPAQLQRAAAEYRVVSVVHQDGPPAAYALDHSSVLFLMAPDGRLVTPVPANANEAVMAQAIRRAL